MPIPLAAKAKAVSTAGADACGTDPGREPRPLSRRTLLGLGGALLALHERGTRAAQPVPVSTDIDPGATLYKLVQRTSFGYSGAEYTRASSMGYDAYLEEQLNPLGIVENPLLAPRLAPYTTLNFTPEQAYAVNNAGAQKTEIIEALIYRATLSRRQLFERLVEFWHDHFNISIDTDAGYLLPMFDRDVIRPLAMGTFPDLLRAVAHSPAMLQFLNNDVSTAAGINENFGRELIELHTMGRDAGYTQSDVRASARAFTGWTRHGREALPTSVRGTFLYNDAFHDKGEKVFLGQTLPAGRGQQDGEDVLNILLADPRTARFIAKKLCARFYGEPTPTALVDAVTAAYTSTGGDIKAMLRVIFQPRVLWDAPPKFKRPLHLFVSAMRALPCVFENLWDVRARLGAAQHVPFTWLAPDGFPDSYEYWGRNLLAGWNHAFHLASGDPWTVMVDPTFYGAPGAFVDLMDRVDQTVFGGTMPTVDKARILNYLQYLPAPFYIQQNWDGVGLALCSSAFFWY